MTPKSEAGATGKGCFRVLYVRVDAVQIPEVVARMERWIQERACENSGYDCSSPS